MQSKGAIKFVAILLALACLWQLSFTLVSSIQEKKAENYAAKAVEEFQNCAWYYIPSFHVQMGGDCTSHLYHNYGEIDTDHISARVIIKSCG